jgi:hypothetical protein
MSDARVSATSDVRRLNRKPWRRQRRRPKAARARAPTSEATSDAVRRVDMGAERRWALWSGDERSPQEGCAERAELSEKDARFRMRGSANA